MTPPVKAITFDVAGTLIQVAEPVGKTYAEWGRRHGVEASEKGLERSFRDVLKAARSPYAARSVGTGDQAELLWWKQVVRDTFAAFLHGEPIPKTVFEPLFADLFEHFARPDAWRTVPGAREILEFLRERMPLGVISNFDSRFYGIAQGHDLTKYFSSVTLSASAGAWKPEKAIFAATAKGLNLPPRNILHVGDDPARDWEGARRAGFQVFEYHPETLPLDQLRSLIE